jgi:hypothetical protein
MKIVAIMVAMTVACCLVPRLGAQEAVVVSNRDRVFANYTREAATVGSGVLRLELRGFHTEDQSNPDLDIMGLPTERVERGENDEVVSTTGNIIDVIGSFGVGNNAEIGFDIPIVLQEYQLESRGGLNQQDIGDMSLYGKFKYKVAERCHVSGGLDLFLPTGPERKYTGTGELGVNPFVSTRYEYKRLAVGGHLGYLLYTGNVKNVLNYSGHVLLRAASTVALRVELSGRNFKQFGETFDDVLVYPGVDLDFFDWFMIRPTGMFNLTAESQDWGVGVGVATHFTLF